MRALLDVNVLVALLDADHVHHEQAMDWLEANGLPGWASCPLTQNGCVRVMAQSSYPNRVPVREAIERLAEATATSAHAFWVDDLSLLDPARFDRSRLHRPAELTDAYLLALAVARGGRLVTFDRTVQTTAVVGAESMHLVVL